MTDLNYSQRRILLVIVFFILTGLVLKAIDRQQRAFDLDLKGFLDGYRHTTVLTEREAESDSPAESIAPEKSQAKPKITATVVRKKPPLRPAEKTVENAGPSLVNPNTAEESELLKLPGIGPVLAQRIIAYRDSGNYFSCAQDLLCVKGIGRGKLEQIERYLEF